MKFIIRVDFLQNQFHGKGDVGREWPPSPLRLFQAIVGSQGVLSLPAEATRALEWLELQAAPTIYTPPVTDTGSSWRCCYGPTNDADRPGREGSNSPYSVYGYRLPECVPVQYEWAESPPAEIYCTLSQLVSNVCWLGQSEDTVRVSASHELWLPQEQQEYHTWRPIEGTMQNLLRYPVRGTTQELCWRHSRGCIAGKAYLPLPPLSVFCCAAYCRTDVVRDLRYSVFELQSPDGSLCSFAKKDMTTIAAQTRHAMLQAAKSQQTGTADWREEFLAGHLLPGNSGLRSLSYVPLPTTGHEHADGRIRRVLLLSPPGESFIPGLRLATQLLHGQDLQEGARLCRVRADVVTTGIGVYQQYCGSSDAWETAVPAIMPGAVHRNRHNVAALISRAIQYAGLPQPKHIEVLPTPRDAIKYFVPQHLQHRGRVRMRITWNQSVTGPVVLGAGRGYGFGLCERAVARAGD